MQNLVIPLDSKEAMDPRRFGPKAANLSAIGMQGIPTPGGYCLDSEAYRIQLKHLGLEDAAKGVFSSEDSKARRFALDMKLGLLDQPIKNELADQLSHVWNKINLQKNKGIAVRSSALVEDRYGSSFAGQFESFLGIDNIEDFFTSVRSCWCALWSTRALRYMATHDVDPAETAMGLIIQPLIDAKVSGGGLSKTAEGNMSISATSGLGTSIAQGEVVPDRYELTRDGNVIDIITGNKSHTLTCGHGSGKIDRNVSDEPSLSEIELTELSKYLIKVENITNGPAEIEWVLDKNGIKLVQARPLHVEEPHKVDEVWEKKPRLRGHPAGIGWDTGKACVINCECELSRVAPGDVLVTRVASPALSQILPHVSAVVAELGGSTSHLASLARERGIPMVLGVANATRTIPDKSTVAVDGVAGIVRWME